MDAVDCVAGAYWVLPGWSMAMVHVPKVSAVTKPVSALTEQTVGVREV